jgi:hypothetical protein
MKCAPYRVGVFFALVFGLPTLVFAMSSANYQVNWDSVNEGGLDVSTSTNYGMRDTIGEHATGDSTSTNYQISAGYRVGEGSQSFISFKIRNSGDTADTSVCNLGSLSDTVVNTCSYRLRIETNAQNGFIAYMQTNGEMNSNGNATLTRIINDDPFIAGNEAYGLSALTGATAGGVSGGIPNQPAVEASAAQDSSLTFNVDSTPLSFTNATTVLSYSGPFVASTAPSLNTTSLITHAATASSSTAIGVFTQTVTYRVTGSF